MTGATSMFNRNSVCVYFWPSSCRVALLEPPVLAAAVGPRSVFSEFASALLDSKAVLTPLWGIEFFLAVFRALRYPNLDREFISVDKILWPTYGVWSTPGLRCFVLLTPSLTEDLPDHSCALPSSSNCCFCLFSHDPTPHHSRHCPHVASGVVNPIAPRQTWPTPWDTSISEGGRRTRTCC